jgi:hypothetical protein
MQTVNARSIARRSLLVAACMAPLFAGCGGSADPPTAIRPAAVSNVDDPDVYRPPVKTVPPPPPPPPQAANGDSRKQTAATDPDAYVPEEPLARPAKKTNDSPNKKDSPSPRGSEKTVASASLPARPGDGNNSPFDPDAFGPETDRLVRADQNTAAGTDKSNALRVSLEARLRLYQSEPTDVVAQTRIEKDLCFDSREAILAMAFNPPSTASPKNADRIAAVASQLWNERFVAFLDLQHQALTTLSQRPTIVALAALIPNAVMRADLRRTLSRHWPEGPKAIRSASSADYLAAEPGFVAVLKSLVRENQRHAAQKPRSPKLSRPNTEAPSIDESRADSIDSEWNGFLEQLVRDYCRRCHLASLARSAAVYRGGAAVTTESRANSHFPPLPGCEIMAAHRFQWPGENTLQPDSAGGNDLSLDYQRFEKRMKPSKPLLYYRRQLESCVE